MKRLTYYNLENFKIDNIEVQGICMKEDLHIDFLNNKLVFSMYDASNYSEQLLEKINNLDNILEIKISSGEVTEELRVETLRGRFSKNIKKYRNNVNIQELEFVFYSYKVKNNDE